MSYTSSIYHIVFRTKYGNPTIPNEHCEKLYRYIWGFTKNKKCFLYQINGMPDHLHLLIDLHPSISLAEFVQTLKTSTNKWLKENSEYFPDFESWARKYCAISYSIRDKDMIVNKFNALSENYLPLDLVKVPHAGKADMFIREIALKDYKKLRESALNNNIDLVITSSYHSFYYQQSVYNYRYKQNQINCIKKTAFAGRSEHQTGLAVDFESETNENSHYKNLSYFQFLEDNAYKHGFILRYPEDKVAITNYMYQPGHYRYVGKELAQELYQRAITLEEYYNLI